MKKSSLIFTTLFASLLFNGCGQSTTERTSTGINSDNYLKIAKSAYAQQSGAEATLQLEAPVPPNAQADANTLYLTKLIKPRDTKVSELEIQQGNNTLTVQIDTANKYATVTLKGDASAQEVVDMKTFTLAQ